MALAIRDVSTADAAAEIIRELEQSAGRRDAVLRRAVHYAAAIAPTVIETVEKAANGVILLPKQSNLLYWGVHILAAGRCTELCQPLLRLLRHPDHQLLDDIFGDSVTETIKQVFISVFDADTDALLSAIADHNAESFVRWGLLDVLARVTFDGAIPRATTLSFLERFEREALADPGDPAWEGWQEAVIYLGFEELHDKVRQAWQDGRIEEGISDLDFWERQIAIVRALAPGDPGMFEKERFSPITNIVETLRWVPTDDEIAERRARRSRDRSRPDPADAIALDQSEIHWLTYFFDSAKVPETTMTMEQVDGLFCACIAGPPVQPVEAISNIWKPLGASDDNSRPLYDSPEQAEYVLGLLMRHWNSIAQRLDRGYLHEPMLVRDHDARPWAEGFLCGVQMRKEKWRDQKSSLIRPFLTMIVALAEDQEPAPGSETDLRDEYAAALPIDLLRLHHLWRERPDPYAPPTPTRYEGRKVGRNEPCPCGSGKKFKKCCGSPTKSVN